MQFVNTSNVKLTLGLNFEAQDPTAASIRSSPREAGDRLEHQLRGIPFALDAAQDDVLRADLEVSARDAFDKAWKAPVEGEVGARRRTDDPTWPPLIEHARIERPGGTAVDVGDRRDQALWDYMERIAHESQGARIASMYALADCIEAGV
jgi:hypothetical protein